MPFSIRPLPLLPRYDANAEHADKAGRGVEDCAKVKKSPLIRSTLISTPPRGIRPVDGGSYTLSHFSYQSF